jgi:hypothetical protein
VTGLNWMGRGLNLKMIAFFRSINVESLWYKNDCFILGRLRRSFICQTQDLEKIGKLYRHLNTGIFIVLAKPRRYNIMVLHIKRMAAVNRRVCKN